jgi:hypothetical protein
VLYSAWKKQLLGSASRDFEDREAKPGVQEQRREAEPQRLKNLIAEIAAKNLKLKNEKTRSCEDSQDGAAIAAIQLPDARIGRGLSKTHRPVNPRGSGKSDKDGFGNSTEHRARGIDMRFAISHRKGCSICSRRAG